MLMRWHETSHPDYEMRWLFNQYNENQLPSGLSFCIINYYWCSIYGRLLECGRTSDRKVLHVHLKSCEMNIQALMASMHNYGAFISDSKTTESTTV